MADLIRYTGYVAPPRKPSLSGAGGDGTGEVIVSVGGGAVGLPLLRAALAARPLTSLAATPWRLLAGPDIAEADLQNLRAATPSGAPRASSWNGRGPTSPTCSPAVPCWSAKPVTTR